MNPQIKCASVVVCLVYLTIQLTQASQEESIESALKLLDQLKETRHGLSALKRVVTDIDDDLRSQQKRTCIIGGGMSKHCSAALLDDKINMLGFLKSGGSPGKRSVDNGPTDPTEQKLMSSLSDLSRKRKGLEMLQRILDEMENDLIYEQKRTCQFNLGGHCATESAANVADHWHYLNSPLSPGRKRRDTRLYKKLIAGKLFK